MLILRACEPFGGRLGPASARPSRQPLRGFLRMRFFLMPSRRYLILRRRTAPSRRTQDVRAAHHLPIHSQALRMRNSLMLSKDYLMLRSTRRARLEARAAAMQPALRREDRGQASAERRQRRDGRPLSVIAGNPDSNIRYRLETAGIVGNKEITRRACGTYRVGSCREPHGVGKIVAIGVGSRGRHK